ncbi:hypothetical protein [Nitratireductor basaltis]|uniref:Uncharacterized protein n=1 Tax=Nitratireductor basaltis TaxID=472175 RepID=A0A084UBI3_9HYPH|nr:hypothetical protein [Nitratireductor basaltis]KFB10319.1 hypothetical protein EL18_01350 [Nitratireductor basaltis]
MLGIDTDIWVVAVWGLIVVFAAAGRYVSQRKQPPPRDDAYVTAASFGFIEKDIARRLVEAAEGINASMSILADRKQNELQETLDKLVQTLTKRPP